MDGGGVDDRLRAIRPGTEEINRTVNVAQISAFFGFVY